MHRLFSTQSAGLTRRRFLQTAVTALPLAGGAVPAIKAAPNSEGFSFFLLGDLHFDRPDHHDYEWLAKHKPGDLSQIRNYCRLTEEMLPRLMGTLKQKATVESPTFILQVGDLVEGLCGNKTLAAKQNQEAADFIDQALPGLPFLFTKGNHDVTGDGAIEAFKEIFHPWLSRQRQNLQADAPTLTQASYSMEHQGSLFCFFDAYDKTSLDWLESELEKRTHDHCFVILHPPVVPYGARASWHQFSHSRQAAERERLLSLLGAHDAMVIGGHLHKFSLLTRQTPNGGRFTQLAVSSIINHPNPEAKNLLEGAATYSGDQVRLEPAHSPETEPERRAIYDRESPSVSAFTYADLPSHATIKVHRSRVEATVYTGVSSQPWRTFVLKES